MKRIVFGILTAGIAALTLAAAPAHADEYRDGYDQGPVYGQLSHRQRELRERRERERREHMRWLREHRRWDRW
ncbi:MAG: hypothetical protein ACXWLM_02920 [Myxococcales bacterium]